MTRCAGMGRLPDIVDASSGAASVRRTFSRAGLPLDISLSPALPLPLASLITLFGSAALETGDRCLGLRVGQSMSYRDFGRWVDYSACAPTLGEALVRFQRAFGLYQSGATFRLQADAGNIIWRYDRPFRPDHALQHTDHTLPPMIGFLREFLGDGWMPDHVRVSYPRDAGAHLAEQMLGTSISFAADCIAVPLRPAELQAPLRRSVALSERVMFEDLLADAVQSHDGSAASAVRQILALRLLQGRTDLEGTAQLAGIGPRTLQRQLRSEGMTYRQIVEHVVVQRAIGLLRETEDSVANIAAALGYNEPGNLTRTVRRVTGRAPVDFRRDPDNRSG